ncbi:hypothetical protein CYMTET_34088, partial [Cymbomonas tetramitiformis]
RPLLDERILGGSYATPAPFAVGCRGKNADVTAEVIFPVAAEAVTVTDGAAASLAGLSVVPGPAGGEGCSASGGCASCPFMKMNTLTALETVCSYVGNPEKAAELITFQPKAYADDTNSEGLTVAQQGCIPILHMRHFQANKNMAPSLIEDVLSRS